MRTTAVRRQLPFALVLVLIAQLALVPSRGSAAGQDSQAPDAAGADAAPAGDVLQLTLEDALRIAVAENLTLALEDQAVEEALANSVGSWGAFDPVLDLTGTYSEANEPQQNLFFSQGVSVIENDVTSLNAGLALPITTGGSFNVSFDESEINTNNPGTVGTDTEPGPFPDGDFYSSALVLGFNQPLLRGAWSRTATSDQRLAEISLDRARAQRLVVRDRLIADVSNAYWDLVAAREEEQVRIQALELANEQLSQNRERLRVGVGTEVDVLQAETQVAQEEEQLLRARSDVNTRSDGLKALLLRRGEASDEAWESYLELWSVPIEPLTDLPAVDATASVPPWRDVLAEALGQRPELLQGLLDVDSAQVGLDRAESNRLPGLDLNLSARSETLEDEPGSSIKEVGDFDTATYSGSLSFNLPLRNRTARFAEQAARAQLRSARLAYEQTEASIVTEVRNAVREVEYQAQAVAAARKSREFTQRQLEAEQARYAEGLATTFQVLEFQQQLAQAQSTERATMAAFAKAEVALDLATGRIAGALGDDSAQR